MAIAPLGLTVIEGGSMPTIKVNRLKRERYQVMLWQLREFLTERWLPGSETSAFNARGEEVEPESETACWFSIAGACRKLFPPDAAAAICFFITEVNWLVNEVPITYLWEIDQKIPGLHRLMFAAGLAAESPIDIKFIEGEVNTDLQAAAKERIIQEIRAQLALADARKSR